MNIKHVSTILCLIHCKILEDKEEIKIMKIAENFMVNSTMLRREDFFKIEFWFEKDPSSSLKYGNNNCV